MLGGAIGLTRWLPSDWLARFASSSPVADASFYQKKANALARLRDAQSRMTEAVKQLDDAQLDAPFPVAEYLDVYPTIRHALTQVLVGHTANHIGQISVWRRAMGLPPIERGFQ